MKKTFIYLLISFFSFATIQAQQLPPRIKWQQIKTEHFKIIYPQEIDSIAQDVANNMEALYSVDAKTIDGYCKWRVPLILNNYTAMSNGFSALMPRRMEWYLMPYYSTYLGFESWTSTLAIHEYRHIVQFKALDKGATRWNHILQGELGQAMGIGFSTPMWFLEGDAVFQETILSPSGRGRAAMFAMPVKAIALEYPDKNLDYYRFFYRSYKTYYPNWYYLGYYLVTYFNRHYGPEAWQKVIKTAADYSFIPGSMNLSLRLNYKLSYRKLFDSTFAELKTYWTEKTDSGSLTPVNFVDLPQPRSRTSFRNPFFINDTSLVYIKYGFDDPATIATLKDSTEVTIRQIPDYNFSAAKNLITWTDLQSDPRWGKQYYSDIALYDINTKKLRYLTSRGKYQSPRLSPDASQLVAVSYNEKMQPALEIFDLANGKTKTYNLPRFGTIRQPAFSHDNKKIVFTATDASKGIGLFILNTADGKISRLLPFSWNGSIENPVFWQNYVIFTSDVHGTNEIHALDTASGKLFQITNTVYGCTQPYVSPDGKRLYFGNYTADGWRLAWLPLNPNTWKPVNFDRQNAENYFLSDSTARYLQIMTDPQKYVTKRYTPTKYNHLAHWLYPHTWLPGAFVTLNDSLTQIDNYELMFGLWSTDLLSETNFILLETYNSTGELTTQAMAQLMRYYPVISLSFSNTRRFYDTTAINNGTLSITLPYDFSRDIWARKATLDFTASLSQTKSNNENNIYTPLGANFSVYNIKQAAYRDVQSKISQSITLSGSYFPQDNGYQYGMAASTGIPGFSRHDGITLTAGFQKINTSYPASKLISLPRGYSAIDYKNIEKFSLTYHLPLVYPDMGIKPLFFVKRVRTKMFYDLAYIDGQRQSSVGGQLLFDMDFFGFPFELSLGVQAAYLIETNTWDFAPVFLDLPINF